MRYHSVAVGLLRHAAGRIQTLRTWGALQATALPPRLKINEGDITESFLKGSGPGGQKINKTSSAVQLKHLPTGLVVKSQDTRSRSQNRKIARRLLADKLEQMMNGAESRTAIKAETHRKKRASKLKKTRRKYRRLLDATQGDPAEDDEQGDGDGDGEGDQEGVTGGERNDERDGQLQDK